MEQNRIIHFFDYNKAFKHYTTIIDSMRQGYIKNSGIRKIAKPILILSLIYGIEHYCPIKKGNSIFEIVEL